MPTFHPIFESPWRRARSAILAGLALLVGACESTTEPLTTAWRATLNPVAPYMVGGQAAALTRSGRTQLTVSIEDADGVPHTWRVEKGTCQAPGEIQAGPGAYPVLEPDAGGAASAEASIATQFRSGDSFIVRVFRSPEGGPDEPAACGPFQETGL